MSNDGTLDEKQVLKEIQDNYELNKPLSDTLEFLIKDNAFDADFLITTIMEYATREMAKQKKLRRKK